MGRQGRAGCRQRTGPVPQRAQDRRARHQPPLRALRPRHGGHARRRRRRGGRDAERPHHGHGPGAAHGIRAPAARRGARRDLLPRRGVRRAECPGAGGGGARLREPAERRRGIPAPEGGGQEPGAPRAHARANTPPPHARARHRRMARPRAGERRPCVRAVRGVRAAGRLGPPHLHALPRVRRHLRGHGVRAAARRAPRRGRAPDRRHRRQGRRPGAPRGARRHEPRPPVARPRTSTRPRRSTRRSSTSS